MYENIYRQSSIHETLLTPTRLYGCLPQCLQPLSAALLHVDHILVVSLQRPLQAVHCLKHQMLALIQLLLENLQSVNLNIKTHQSVRKL